jgi:hypothetical protein
MLIHGYLVAFVGLLFKGLYMFRALLAHPRETLYNGTWYTACVLCQLAASGLKCKFSVSKKCRVFFDHLRYCQFFKDTAFWR